MTALPAPHLVNALVENLDGRLLRTGTDRDFVATLCSEAIAFAWEPDPFLPSGHVGQRARTSAQMLLGLGAPEMTDGLRSQIALACEIIAIGARPAA